MTNADAIDWGAAPIAAVTGVVRLRNEEEVPVRCDGYGCREVTGRQNVASRTWRDGAYGGLNGLTRHLHDIVAQLCVGPTEPGVYETHAGPITVVLRGGIWESGPRGEMFDEFGRATVHVDGFPGGHRVPQRDLLGRVGDVLPPTCRQAPPQRYTAEEGAAAMNALCPPHDPGAFDREAYSREKSELLAILEEVASLIPVAVQRVLVSHALAKASKTGGTTTSLPSSPKS